jgi:hypothetical protein
MRFTFRKTAWFISPATSWLAVRRAADRLAGGLQDVTAFIDFGPRIADIPDALMARIMACRPIVSLNRQEAELAAERLGVEAENLGEVWQQRFRRRADCAP